MWKVLLTTVVVCCGVLTGVGVGDEPNSQFAPPTRLKAGGKLIDADMGNAAPYFADFDEDGKKDLLLGQFDAGKLRIYRNVGTTQAPRFETFSWFQADGNLANIPAG